MSEEEQIFQIYQYLTSTLVERTSMLSLPDETKLEIINLTLDILLYTLQPKYSSIFLAQLNEGPKDSSIKAEIKEAYDIIQSSMKGKE